jgi:hypothetical protein
LRHITDEEFMDASMDENVVDSVENSPNDPNDDVLAYFARISNHYLRLAEASTLPLCHTRHPMKYPIIADSGANYHLFKEREFFIDICITSGTVLLGDGKTVINIEGVGTVQCLIESHVVTLHNVYFIPDLGESIYSLFLHIKTPGCGLESTSDKGLFLIFLSSRQRQ